MVPSRLLWRALNGHANRRGQVGVEMHCKSSAEKCALLLTLAVLTVLVLLLVIRSALLNSPIFKPMKALAVERPGR